MRIDVDEISNEANLKQKRSNKMNTAMHQPGTAGETVVDATKPTLEEVLLCVHDCVHTMKEDSYRRAYRRFANAVVEAQSELSLEVINQVLNAAADAFDDSEVSECDEGGEFTGMPILEQITADTTKLQLLTPTLEQFKEAVELATTDLLQRGFEVYGSISPTNSFDLVIYKDGNYRSIQVAVAS
jgi:hypothetical protein